MKHHHNLRLKILIFSVTGPLLIFTCLSIGLISYLVYNLDDGASRSAPDSKTVRIRTIPSLNPVSPASVRTEPELHMAEVSDDDNSGPPALTEAPLLPAAPTESVGDADVQIGPMPAVAARVELEAVPTESAVPESVLSDPIVGEAGTTVGPQNEMSPPVERVLQIEIPTEYGHLPA